MAAMPAGCILDITPSAVNLFSLPRPRSESFRAVANQRRFFFGGGEPFPLLLVESGGAHSADTNAKNKKGSMGVCPNNRGSVGAGAPG